MSRGRELPIEPMADYLAYRALSMATGGGFHVGGTRHRGVKALLGGSNSAVLRSWQRAKQQGFIWENSAEKMAKHLDVMVEEIWGWA